MGTSETPEQLTIRLEMGQGRTVHFFIARNGKEAREVKEIEEVKELRGVAAASVGEIRPAIYFL
jgi:hypothetical protein